MDKSPTQWKSRIASILFVVILLLINRGHACAACVSHCNDTRKCLLVGSCSCNSDGLPSSSPYELSNKGYQNMKFITGPRTAEPATDRHALCSIVSGCQRGPKENQQNSCHNLQDQLAGQEKCIINMSCHRNAYEGLPKLKCRFDYSKSTRRTRHLVTPLAKYHGQGASQELVCLGQARLQQGVTKDFKPGTCESSAAGRSVFWQRRPEGNPFFRRGLFSQNTCLLSRDTGLGFSESCNTKHAICKNLQIEYQ